MNENARGESGREQNKNANATALAQPYKIPQYLNSAALTHKKHFEKVANLLFSRSFGDCEAN